VFLLVVALLAGFSLTSCNKGDDKPKVDKQGLTKEIRDLVPKEIFQNIEDLGMPIYGGNTPPNITGTFLCSPAILAASNFNDAYKPGHKFVDQKIIYSDQNNSKLTIKVQNIEGTLTEGNGIGGFIVGKEEKFTVFVGLDDVDYHGHESKTVRIYSGILTDGGIKDLYIALVMVDDGGDPDNNLIENGQGRLIYDSDGFSERLSSKSNAPVNRASSIEEISSEVLLPITSNGK